MALVPKVLSAQILAAMQKAFNSKDEPAAAQRQFADDLANAIDAYIKSGQVVGTATTVVTGTCPAGPVAGNGSGSINGNMI